MLAMISAEDPLPSQIAGSNQYQAKSRLRGERSQAGSLKTRGFGSTSTQMERPLVDVSPSNSFTESMRVLPFLGMFSAYTAA